jgi:hypothetical protein
VNAFLNAMLCGIARDHGPALFGIAQDLHTNSIQKSPALCGMARDHGPALCSIARDHDPALCSISRDQHIFVNFSTNSKQNSKIF